MPFNIYPDFPTGQNDTELTRILKEYTSEIYFSRANINTVLQLTPLIQLGFLEVQGREMSKMNSFSKRLTWASFGISCLSLLMAGFAIYLSVSDNKTSEVWKNGELNKLDQIIELIDH